MPPGLNPVAEYIYVDNFGEPLYRKLRFNNPKRFVWESKHGDAWRTGLNGTQRVLYRLPDVISSPPDRIWLPEGEKDVESLRAIGLVATTSGGTSDPWLQEFNKFFAGRDVVILTDADGPGWARGDRLIRELFPVARSVRVVSFVGMGLPNGSDVTDWLALGHTAAELEAIADRTPIAEPPSDSELNRIETNAIDQDGHEVHEVREAIVADMDDAVLSGRLGEICQRHLSDFPIAYAWLALVTVAGVLVKGANVLPTNLFAALVGPVGTGKTQASERAMRVLGLDPEGAVPPVLKLKAGSGEGLLKAIGDVLGEARLYSVDEYAHLLEKAQVEHSTFAQILNGLFYGPRQALRIAKGESINFNCLLSILGGLVDTTFGDAFGKTTTTGLYDRTAFGQCPTGFSYDYRPFQGEVVLAEPRAVSVHPEVWEVRTSWMKTIPGITGRVAEIALRVAGISAAFDGKSILTAKDLGPALAFAQYQARIRILLRPNSGETYEGRIAFKFLAYLHRHAPDGQWVSKRQMMRDTRAYDIGPSTAGRALNVLIYNGDIEETSKGKQALVRLIP